MKLDYSHGMFWGMIEGLLSGVKIGDRYPIRIMGVINLSSNSFFGGSVMDSDEKLIATALEMEKDGANIIDIGGRSTAPYRSYEIPTHVETKLLKHATKILARNISIPLSADTTRVEAARAAIGEGATIINDVYGFTQRDGKNLASLVSKKDASVIISAHEYRNLVGGDPIRRVQVALQRSLQKAARAGIPEGNIIIDPALGFFYDPDISNVQWNSTIINRLSELRNFNKPICVGASRKKFIGVLSKRKDVNARLWGSIAASAISAYNGAHLIRTHDVKETMDAVRVAKGFREKGLSGILR